MKNRGAAAVLIAVFVIASAGVADAAAFDAQFEQVRVPALRADTEHDVFAAVWNRGSVTWTSDAPIGPVFVSYHWLDGAGAVATWDGLRTRLPSPIGPGEPRSLKLRVRTPAAPGTYVLVLQMVREGVEWFGEKHSLPATTVHTETFVSALAPYDPSPGGPGGRVAMRLLLRNDGSATWNANGSNPVRISYHWYDLNEQLLVWDGERTNLGRDVAPGERGELFMSVVLPERTGRYRLVVELVHEGIAWFSQLGSERSYLTVGVPSGYDAMLVEPSSETIRLPPSGDVPITLRVRNLGQRTWPAAGPNPIRLSYHLQEAMSGAVVWDGPRASLPRDVAPGEEITLTLPLRAPEGWRVGYVRYDLVVEGFAWFSEIQPKGGLGNAMFVVSSP
jgi:hypothetical protein